MERAPWTALLAWILVQAGLVRIWRARIRTALASRVSDGMQQMRLAEPRADTAADAHAALARAFVVLDLVEFHGRALAFAFVAQLKD